MPSFRIAHMTLFATLLLPTACQQEREVAAGGDSSSAALPEGHVPVTRAIPLPAAAQVVIDSGNAAFSAKDYVKALALYRRTLELAPGHPAPWFGISMAAGMLGDSALQDTAQRMLRLKGADGGAPHGAPAPPVPANPHGAAKTS